MKKQALPKQLSLLVQNLSNAIEKEGKLSPSKVKEVVKETNITEEDLLPYADFNHPIEDCYGRKLVFDNGNFEVMVMSWNPNHYSSIHNHGYTQWGVVQVFGHAHHLIYHVKDDLLKFSKKEILPKGGIVKVNNKFIHQMGNASTTPYMSLHVYGCNDRNENITADAKNYDLEFNRVSQTTGGAFFNLPTDAIYNIKKGPRPTDEVFLQYAYLLMSYYDRQPQSIQINTLKQNLLSQMKKRMVVNEVVGKQSGPTQTSFLNN